jgi:primosomal protein N'
LSHVESYFAAKNDKLKYVFLGKRFGDVALPKYEIINFKEAQESKLSVGHFSQILIDKISENLQNKKQSIILHNRRGYANVVECESCGNVTYCSNCDVVMTYHKATNGIPKEIQEVLDYKRVILDLTISRRMVLSSLAYYPKEGMTLTEMYEGNI